MFPHVSAVNSTLLGCLRWLEVKVSDFSEKPVEKGPPGTVPVATVQFWGSNISDPPTPKRTDSMGDLRMAMFD